MKLSRFLVTCTLLVVACRPAKHAQPSSPEQQAVAERLQDATGLLKDVGKKVPGGVAREVVCAVILPGVVRGGLILGARHGHGFAVCETDEGVSPPAPITLTGGSAGLQLGVESADVLMLITTEAGRSALMRGHFEIGADVSVAAGPVGGGQQRSTDTKFRAPIVTYTRSSGLFAGAVVSGVVLEQDQDSTRALYGKDHDTREILAGKVGTPPLAEDFMAAIEDAVNAASGRN